MILFEWNTRVHGKRFDQISDQELSELRALGFDWIWMMGIWRISPAVLAISKRFGHDFEGSPYAIADYEISPLLGGEQAFRDFVRRAREQGLRVMADFVPNHMAVDSPLIDAHPEWVIHSNPSLRDERPEDYFDHKQGRLAHGKDPYFAGWVDTVQLDYSHPGLRAHMIHILRRLASLVDGLRCDMAMLVLRDQIKTQWFPRIPQELFDQHFPGEFWPIAIESVRAERPDFIFMAEVYWDKEAYLQELGFDFTYNKKLYDMLAHHPNTVELTGYLSGIPNKYLRHCTHFLENHDEERAAQRFGARSRPCAMLSYSIPGAVFVHQGQMEGYLEKLPVQRVRPLRKEHPDRRLLAFYARLLWCVKDPIFRIGEFTVLHERKGLVLFCRSLGKRRVLIGIDPAREPTAENPALEIALSELELSAHHKKSAEGGPHPVRKAFDLWNAEEIHIECDASHLKIHAGYVKSYRENGGLIIELHGE